MRVMPREIFNALGVSSAGLARLKFGNSPEWTVTPSPNARF